MPDFMSANVTKPIKPAAHAILPALVFCALSFLLAVIWKLAVVVGNWAYRVHDRLIARGHHQMSRFEAWLEAD